MQAIPIFVAAFGPNIERIEMGEYTLHCDGTLERAGVRQKHGEIRINEEKRRITVCDWQGRPVVTESFEQCRTVRGAT